MRHTRLCNTGLMAAAAIGMAVAQTGEEAWVLRRQKLGTEDPYRILVDKVLMASNEWRMLPEHVAEIRDPGFNVVVPRIGDDDNDRVRRAARMAVDHGLFYRPWIRGTRATKGPASQRATDGKGRYGKQ